MSSAKKKSILVTCPQCDAVLLTKDSNRHQDFCGKSAEESEISCARNGVLRGFNVAIDKAESFLPPDAVGWEKEHSILINQQTMETLGLLARQPVRIRYSDDVFIGIVWPCKEVALLKISILSTRIPRERMITMETLNSIDTVTSLGITVESTLRVTVALKGFLEAYLSHSYLEYGLPVVLKYLGQIVKVIPEEPIEQRIGRMGLDAKSRPTVISTSVDFRIQILNSGTSSETTSSESPKPQITDLSNIGGAFGAKRILTDYVITPVLHRHEPPCSVLIWGLPGSGKTLLLQELSRVLSGNVTYIGSCDELVELGGDVTGQVVIVDLNEVEKENSKVNHALGKLLAEEKTCVILCVRSSESLDLGFRVRFPVEAEITVPTQEERLEILSKISANFNNFPPENHLEIARHTHGFTGGDLCSLLKASRFARGDTPLDRVNDAKKRIRPTGIRQFILEVPNVSWQDIGGNEELKLEIQQAVIWPQKHPEAFERFGIDPPAGILLYGPPGCSKTLIARALANEAKMNFLAVKGPELFSKWVGDSEKAIRDLFSRARQVAPTIVFFDEIDAVGSSRGSEKSSGVSDRVLAQLLTELDGLEKSSRVVLLAATNRPDQLDSALLRPGRLDRAIYVGLPCEVTRRAILEMRTRKMKFEDPTSTIQKLVEKTSGYSGAELVAVCRTAAMFAMRESIEASVVQWKHFEEALVAVVSRTEAYLLEIYEDFKAGRTSNA
ncbi:hypothetical protein GCK72_000441 [Caenorhabditis remanei]|uniref:AAA+ ATPase domain-containing protein n=1 Tax=Caenorhabditis remanei TaxID=31234 RepID=A0A6A5HM28_CAERE|nr:hypothetical protein GCK72_000441 [Caenorhabditis remanei]KAF1768629.1 hypothetical protein GCK72_000441 [Caenorhabditis remanei]